MTQELQRELTAAVLTLRRPAIIMIGMTLSAYLLMLLLIRRLEAEGGGNRLAGLFVGLDGRSLLHLSAAWCKFAFFAALLIVARPIEQNSYILLLSLSVLTLLPGINRLSAWLTELIGATLITSGLWVCSTLISYLRQIRYDVEIYIAYWVLCLFLVLCAAAILLREVTLISGERNYFDEKGEVD